MVTAVAEKRFVGAPNRLKEVRPSQNMLERYDKAAKTKYRYYADKADISVEAYIEKVQAHMKTLVETTDLWMRVRPHALEGILESGRFKSQFETNTSCGSLSPSSRADCECAFFNYPIDIDPKKRPVYGYMTDDADGLGYGSYDTVGHYGKCAIKFKKDLTARKATYTFDDSLSEASIKYHSMSIVSVPYIAPSYRAINLRNVDDDFFKIKHAQDIYPYAEVQYHKGLRVKHIEQVVFHSRTNVVKALLDKLDALAIPYRFVNC